MKNEFIKYLNLNSNSKQRITLVGKIEEGKIKIGVAVNSKRDQFNKKIGRRIAEGRLEKKPFVLTYTDNPLKTLNDYVFSCVSREKSKFLKRPVAFVNRYLTGETPTL